MWLCIDIRETGRTRVRLMAAVELLLGAAAVDGGIELMRDGLGMRDEWIAHTLLPSWYIPGLLLAVVIGGGMLTAAVLTLRNRRVASVAGLVMGSVLLIWLAVETLMIGWHGGPQWLLDGLCAALSCALIALAAPQLRVKVGNDRPIERSDAIRENAYRGGEKVRH